MTTACDFTVTEFGPVRAIGVSRQATPGKTDFGAIWGTELIPRKGEIAQPANAAAFGVCRCLPGAPQGDFEYMALVEATADSPVPAGMTVLQIPRVTYAVFPVSSYSQFGATWQRAASAIGAHGDWVAYCGPEGCQCATHPSFEYYPWEPEHSGRAFIYIPIRRRGT